MLWNPFKRRLRRQHKNFSESPSWLKSETKQAVAGVLIFVLSVIILFSFAGRAGRVGEVFLGVLRQGFGWFAYGLPLLGIYISYRLLRPSLEPLSKWRFVGGALAIAGVLGSLHLINVRLDDALQVAAEGKGGGYIGFMLSYPLSLALSPLISLLIFLASLVIGIFIAFNLTPRDIAQAFRWFWPKHEPVDEPAEVVEDEADASLALPALPRFNIRAMGGGAKPDADQLKLDEANVKKELNQEELRRKQLRAANKKYNPPPLEILSSSSRQPEAGDVKANKAVIASTLEHFGIAVTMGEARIGPTVTQYTFRPDEGIRLSQITALQNDLARALKAHPVRVEAPIPNTDLVGIEIPNKQVALVRLRDLLSSKEMRHQESPLTFALGKDVAGGVISGELDRMPHVLIAGATNSGKSVCIHSIIMSLLYRNSPSLLRLVLVDPKRVELSAYNGIPHLWGEPVIVDTGKTLNALKWALREMDRRYKLLEEAGARNLLSYNISNPDDALPFIVIIIDELADLMAKHSRDVEGPIVRLSQLARAVGIHLVLATQRPSVNVITGLIKANIPTRIAFKVASQVDSRTILDMSGAEKLLGTGDMLYLATDNTKPRRLQGGFVSEEEVRAAVKFIAENNSSEEYVEDEPITSAELSSAGSGGDGAGDDDLFEEAKRIAMDAGKISASLLQRRLRVGYARAARLLDMLQEQGVIGEADGNKPREVLVREEAEQNFGPPATSFAAPIPRQAPLAPTPMEDPAPSEDEPSPEDEDVW